MLLSKKLEDNIVMIVKSLGYEVYDIETTASRIVIYIDKVGGVSIGDCENVSRNIDVLLDAEDPFASSYILEVSSPGINRKLKKKWHFEKALNRRCAVKTHSAIEDSKVFKGVLIDVRMEEIVIKTEKGSVNIAFDNIKSARIDEEIGGKKKV